MRRYHLGVGAFGFLSIALLSCLFLSHAVSQGDTDVLIRLRDSIDNPASLKWTDPSPCTWGGIRCTPDQRVTRIQIGGHNLSGSLPSELNRLTLLDTFEVMENQFSGPLPNISGLSQLTNFNCHSNNFSSIPFGFFSGLTALRKIYLDNNPFESWELPLNLAEATNLAEFSANSANINGKIPNIFDNLNGLQSLHLAMNYLEGALPSSLAKSPIQSLWVNGQQSSSKLNGTISMVGVMKGLTEVWLHGNNFTGPIPKLSNLTSLKVFSVRDNKLTGPVPESLVMLPNLAIVNVTNNLLQGQTPKFPSSVNVDMVRATNRFCLDDPGVPCDHRVDVLLSIVQALNYPDILADDWKGNDPCANWRGILCSSTSGNITVINFPNMGLSGSISANFSLIPSLQKLILSDNGLYGKIPPDLTTLPSLALLDVSNNNLYGEVPNFKPGVQVKFDGNPNIGKDIPPPGTPPSSGNVNSDNKNFATGKIVGSVIGVICGLGVIALGVFIYGKKRKLISRVEAPDTIVIHPRHDSEFKNGMKLGMIQSSATGGIEKYTNSNGESDILLMEAGNRAIPLQVLRNVTNNFSEENVLGKGGFGTVYKGELDDGTKVAVKRMQVGVNSDKGLVEFVSEVTVLSKVRHRHLVGLIGYCLEENEKLLVYEYMPQGTLSRYLFNWKQEGLEPLDWATRLTIALDVARGVEYLHELAQQSFIHRDLKPSNILLGDDMRAKVADFGLVRLAPEGKNSIETKLAGTFGYLAPEYAVTGRVTTKVDVYSFGVILMEIITGRKALDNSQPDECFHLVTWFHRMRTSEDTFRKSIDNTIDCNEETLSSIDRAADLACHCTARDPYQRPHMAHVVNVLSQRWNPVETESDYTYGFDSSVGLPGMMNKWDDTSNWDLSTTKMLS